jgi:RND family efflux transporter MFP subunit
LAQIPITKETTREAREQVSSAQAALRQAEANRAQLPVAQQNISVARAEVQAAQAQLEQAQVNLAYARITSPVDGVVVKKMTNAGETTSPGAALMEIVALNSVYFEAQISETNIASVLDRQPVIVTIPSVSPKPFTGYVSEVIPVADPSSRQFRVRVTVPTRGKPLTPGAFARGVITTRAVKNTLAVPTDAVHQVDGKSVVYVAQGSGDNITIVSRPVKTGMVANEKTQILSGIAPGDKVIISQEELTPGAKVQISKFAL